MLGLDYLLNQSFQSLEVSRTRDDLATGREEIVEKAVLRWRPNGQQWVVEMLFDCITEDMC